MRGEILSAAITFILVNSDLSGPDNFDLLYRYLSFDESKAEIADSEGLAAMVLQQQLWAVLRRYRKADWKLNLPALQSELVSL